MLLPLSGSPSCRLTAVEGGLGAGGVRVGLATGVGAAEAAGRVVGDRTGVVDAVAGSADAPAGTDAGTWDVNPGDATSPGVPDVAGATVVVAEAEPAGTDAVSPAPAEQAQTSRPQPMSATSQRARAGGSWLIGRMPSSSIVASCDAART